MTSLDRLFDLWGEFSVSHAPESDPQVAVVLAELRETAALDRENTGIESDRELYVMRRWPGWPKGWT